MKITLTFLFFGLFGSTAFAASMTSPEVELSFYSKDGKPVEGVHLTGALHYESLSLKDCSGFICIPSLPHFKSTGDAPQILGFTDDEGRLEISSQIWKAKDLTAKNLSVIYFTNGLVPDLCKDDYKTTQDTLDLLPQFLDGQAVPRNEECQSVEVLSGDQRKVQITCYSPFTSSEIEAKRAQALKTCKL